MMAVSAGGQPLTVTVVGLRKAHADSHRHQLDSSGQAKARGMFFKHEWGQGIYTEVTPQSAYSILYPSGTIIFGRPICRFWTLAEMLDVFGLYSR
jgi:hypothetical protein